MSGPIKASEGHKLPDGFEFVEWTASDVTRFWDFVARVQPHLYFTKQNGAAIVAHFRKEIEAAHTIVDFGCGPGFFLDHVLRAGKLLYGFDVSEESLDSLRTRLKDQPGFAGAFGLDQVGRHSGQFDLAFCLEVVEHLDDETLREALASVHRLLKTGGRLIVSTPNEETLSDSFVCAPETGRVFHRWQHVRSWTAQDLSNTLHASGFAVERCYACHVSALGFSPGALARRAAFRLTGRKPTNLFAVAKRR